MIDHLERFFSESMDTQIVILLVNYKQTIYCVLIYQRYEEGRVSRKIHR